MSDRRGCRGGRAGNKNWAWGLENLGLGELGIGESIAHPPRLCYTAPPLNNRTAGAMAQSIYKVVFHNQGRVYEIYARRIFQSDMWGFLEVEEFLFGERSQVVVDPAEEKLKNEFAGVKRSYIPIVSVIRIDEVDKEGAAKISEASSGGGNVSAFPLSGPGSGPGAGPGPRPVPRRPGGG